MASFPPIFPSASAAFAAVSASGSPSAATRKRRRRASPESPAPNVAGAPHGSLGVLQEHRQVHGRVRILQARDREGGLRAQPGIGRGCRAAREKRIVRAAVLHAEEAGESDKALPVRAFRRALLGAERDTAREDDGRDERGGRASGGRCASQAPRPSEPDDEPVAEHGGQSRPLDLPARGAHVVGHAVEMDDAGARVVDRVGRARDSGPSAGRPSRDSRGSASPARDAASGAPRARPPRECRPARA